MTGRLSTCPKHCVDSPLFIFFDIPRFHKSPPGLENIATNKASEVFGMSYGLNTVECSMYRKDVRNSYAALFVAINISNFGFDINRCFEPVQDIDIYLNQN